ncbi:MAG: hypothetical protein MUF84_15285 [Anaerolineae bacterium]|jgi:hypothetical protein|nr:hypothetical protein [Anaerolineae bacterium]
MGTSSMLGNDQYWEHFAVQPSDLEFLANFLVESERPQTLDELATKLTHYRHMQITQVLDATLSQGRIYRPGEAYAVGERLIFAHLGNDTGQVVAMRVGHNPEFEPFTVVQVEMDEGAGQSRAAREFVSELQVDHPLNTASYHTEEEITADDIYEEFGAEIRVALLRALETSAQFVNVAHRWFVRALLADVSPGQVNIAEAMLDMAEGGPMRTDALLQEIDLPDEISPSLQIFSLEHAMLRDRRFDDVGPSGYALWYLRSHEPKEVLETPRLLHYLPVSYNRQVLDRVMLSLETQVADEWSELTRAEASGAPVSLVLTYPHWRSGTLPLAPHVANFFPTARITDRIRFTFADDVTGKEFPGWVVRSGRYVYGLESWYKAKQAFVGSYIDLALGDEPGVVRVGVRPIRSQRREWLRTVTVEGDQLVFEVTRVPAACEYDELAAVAVVDAAAVDALRERYDRMSLESLLERAFGGLAGLSLQRAVHAMTLYSVLNLMRRVPPAPMLATLATSPRYISLGDNYWAYQGGA